MRFTEFTDHERVMLAFGLTLVLADELLGAITGEAAPPETQLRDFPVLVELMNEIGGEYGAGVVNPELVARAIALMELMVAKPQG